MLKMLAVFCVESTFYCYFRAFHINSFPLVVELFYHQVSFNYYRKLLENNWKCINTVLCFRNDFHSKYQKADLIHNRYFTAQEDKGYIKKV